MINLFFNTVFFFLFLGIYSCNDSQTKKYSNNENLVFESKGVRSHEGDLQLIIDSCETYFKDFKELFIIFNDSSKTDSLKIETAFQMLSYFESSCFKNIYLEDWWDENGTYKFFKEIRHLNKNNFEFNGIEFIVKIDNFYSNAIELSQYLSTLLASICSDTPSKFLTYIEALEDSKREVFLRSIYWQEIDIDQFKKEIKGSKHFEQILEIIKNNE